MNCQEVMELMQRQLDEDLDAREEAELTAHLEHCLDCAQMRERLKQLSNELTNLPKVLPTYSLVDAILPKLGEIDMQHEGSGHDIYRTTTIPAAQQPREIPWTRRFGAGISWKVAGGVVAAGLIMGFFLFQTNNPLSNQADSMLSPGKETNGGSSAVGEQKADTSKHTSADKPMNEASPFNQDPVSVENQNGSPKGAEQGSKATQSDDKSADPSMEPKTNGALSSGMQTPKGEDGPRETAPVSSGASTSAPSSAPAAIDHSNRTATQGPQATNSPDAGGAASPNTEPAAAAEQASPAPDRGVRNNTGSNIMSIAQMPEETLVSSDGRYLASIEQYHVTIKDNSTHEIIFASGRYWTDADKVTLLEWSADGKLKYRVSNDTSTQNFEIDAGKKSEILLK